MAYRNPEILSRPAIEVVALTTTTTVREIAEQTSNVKQVQESFEARCGEITGRVGSELYLIQIYPDVPDFNHETPFQVLIGARVEPGTPPPDGMVSHTIPAGEYLKVTHLGLESALSPTYDYLYGTALPQSGRRRIGFDMEIWDERYQPESPANEIDIYVALA